MSHFAAVLDANVLGFDIEAQHPDTFLRHLIDLAPKVVRTRIELLLGTLMRPAMTI